MIPMIPIRPNRRTETEKPQVRERNGNMFTPALATKANYLIFVLLAALFFGGCGTASNGPKKPQNNSKPDSNDRLEPNPLEAIIWLSTDDGEGLRLDERRASFEEADENSDENANELVIEVDDETEFQTIVGVGAALTDSAAWLIGTRMNDDQRGELLERLFDPDKGIGLSALRHPIGSTDFSLRNYTYDDMPEGESDPKLDHFSIDYDRQYTIPLLREIQAHAPELFIIGSSWSAPAWMKTNDKLFGGSLKSEYYGAYADYFVRYIQAFRDEGVEVDAITPQNEPLHEAPTYPGMRMEAHEEADFIKNHLGPAFHENDLKTQIYIYDHNWDRPDYPLAVLDDEDARKYITGTAFHCYGGNVANQTQVHEAWPDKSLFITECTGLVGSPFGRDLIWSMQNLFIGGMRRWAKGVLYWNLALDDDSGPKNGGCQNCRGIVTVNEESGEVTFNTEFYALAHVSLAARPGAVRIDSDMFAGRLESVAFRNPDGSKGLVVVTVGEQEEKFKIRWKDHTLSFTLPPESVATFRWP